MAHEYTVESVVGPPSVDLEEGDGFTTSEAADGECHGLPECAGLCCRSWEELHPEEIM